MNIKVVKYINELLYDNDCVIIPNLGGFVSSYKSAEVHPIKHQFLPPSKRIAFNEKLQLNDGLLISNLASGEGISLKDATSIITQFTQEIVEILKNKEKVIFDKIGSLFKNQEGRLQFKAEIQYNYLDDSFGLPEFFSTPILRDTKNKKLRNKFKDRAAMSTEEKNKKKQSNSKQKKGSGTGFFVLGAVALLLAVSAVYLFVIDSGDKVSQLSSLLPFGNDTTEEVVIDTTATELVNDSTDYYQDEEESIYEDEEVEEEVEEDASFEYESDNTTTEETYEASRESNNTSENFLNELTGRYYVIAGAFSVQSNAEDLRNNLISKGYNAKILSPKGKKPFYRVSIEDFDNADEGNSKVASENPDFENVLWLLKY